MIVLKFNQICIPFLLQFRLIMAKYMDMTLSLIHKIEYNMIVQTYPENKRTHQGDENNVMLNPSSRA